MARKSFKNDKIVIETPRGQIIQRRYTKGSKKGELYARLEWNPGFGKERTAQFNNAQAFVDNEVLRYSSAYVPFQSGMLQKSGILGTVVGSGTVQWIAPYSKMQYYSTADSRSYDEKRGAHWFERMKADHGKAIIAGAKKMAGRG